MIGARDVAQYYLEGQKAGKTYKQLERKLKLVSIYTGAYGDWYEYRDDKGNYWEEYRPIGD